MLVGQTLKIGLDNVVTVREPVMLIVTPWRAELEASKQAKSAAYIHVIEHYVMEKNAWTNKCHHRRGNAFKQRQLFIT